MFKLLFSLLISVILFTSCEPDSTKYDTHDEALNKIQTKIQIDSVFNVNDWRYDNGYRLELKFMSAKITKYTLWHRDTTGGWTVNFTHTYYISFDTQTKRINSIWVP